jgi:hypothetical protein
MDSSCLFFTCLSSETTRSISSCPGSPSVVHTCPVWRRYCTWSTNGTSFLKPDFLRNSIHRTCRHGLVSLSLYTHAHGPRIFSIYASNYMCHEALTICNVCGCYKYLVKCKEGFLNLFRSSIITSDIVYSIVGEYAVMNRYVSPPNEFQGYRVIQNRKRKGGVGFVTFEVEILCILQQLLWF